MWLMAAALAFSLTNSRAAALQSADTDDVRGLPIKEVHPSRPGTSGDLLVVFITGDGGWAALDKEVAAALVDHGAWVVGLDGV